MAIRCWSKFWMSRLAGSTLLGVLGMLPLAAEAQWILVARHVVGRVEQVTQQQDNQAPQAGLQQVTQVATVVLDAPANRVYQVATNTTNSNPNVLVISNDPATMTIQLREADQLATLKVTALNKGVSQLMIIGSAPTGENPKTTRIVQAVLRLCNDIGKTCQVESQ